MKCGLLHGAFDESFRVVILMSLSQGPPVGVTEKFQPGPEVTSALPSNQTLYKRQIHCTGIIQVGLIQYHLADGMSTDPFRQEPRFATQ